MDMDTPATTVEATTVALRSPSFSYSRAPGEFVWGRLDTGQDGYSSEDDIFEAEEYGYSLNGEDTDELDNSKGEAGWDSDICECEHERERILHDASVDGYREAQRPEREMDTDITIAEEDTAHSPNTHYDIPTARYRSLHIPSTMFIAAPSAFACPDMSSSLDVVGRVVAQTLNHHNARNKTPFLEHRSTDPDVFEETAMVLDTDDEEDEEGDVAMEAVDRTAPCSTADHGTLFDHARKRLSPPEDFVSSKRLRRD